MDAIFLKIVNMSIAASWLILAVILLRVVLKKAPKWINVLLWGIVAIRLVCPFSFESALSLIPSNETIPMDIGIDTTPVIDSGIHAINNAVNPMISQSNTPMAGASINPLQITIGIYENIWILGIAIMLLYAAISFIRLRKKVGASLYLRDNIWICDDIQTPFILGAIKPRIYIPSGTDEAQLPHIIAHENAHLKRRDHWWKPLGFLVLAIHWFNPLVWVAYILLCRDIELACDEKVIRDLNQSESVSYSEALLSCSVNRRMVMVCPLAFGEVGVKERVKRVLNYKKPAFWIIVVALIASVIMAVCFLTNPKQDSFEIRITIPAGTTREMIYQEDFVYSDEEISPLGNKITISSGDGLGDTEVVLKPIEVTEENAYEPTYLTPGMPVEMDVEKGAWFKIGISMQNPTEEDIVVYVEVDGIEVRIEDEVNSVLKWFDYTENPSSMDDEATIKIPIYQDITFSYNQEQIIASRPFDDSKHTGQTILIAGMPIWSAYFTDLTGDDYPEICATYSYGSGIIDNRVVIYDYVNGTSYELSDRGYHDFTLRQDNQDGHLYVDKKLYNSDELVETGRLVFKDNCIQVEGFSNEAASIFQAEILEIHDGYYLVEPVEGSWELSSADRIEVPIKMLDPSLEPEVGDVIEIEYSGEILETYPARIAEVYNIRVATEKQRLSLNDVIILSQKGYDLTWADFEEFSYIETGSGLYIRVYEINDLFRLMIGGAGPDSEPMYIYLTLANDTETKIDIRDGGVTEFISEHNIISSTDPLDAAISMAILEHYASDDPDGLVHVESHVLLANEAVSGTPLFGQGNHMKETTVYLLVFHEKYNTYGGNLEAVGGSYVPTALTFSISESGEYTLKEYWEPRDGSYYAKDIRAKFPGASADDALNDQAYIEELQAQNLSKAQAYLNSTSSIDLRISELLNIIQSSPAYSSNPGDYIEAHRAEYDELLSDGGSTLKFCFTEFLAGGQIDLRGHIMASACKDIISGMGEALLYADSVVMTGQDWFDAFYSNAKELERQYSNEDLEKYYPASWLLLQMISDEQLEVVHYPAHKTLYEMTPIEKIEANYNNEEFVITKLHYENLDGEWACGEYTYKYRLEITGRLNNAAKNTTYIVLSNTEDITFDQTWKASGLSSNMNDYFDPADAVIVGNRLFS